MYVGSVIDTNLLEPHTLVFHVHVLCGLIRLLNLPRIPEMDDTKLRDSM